MTASATPILSPRGEAALRLAAHGWAVFPCAGKRPLTRNGCKNAATDAETVRSFWTRHRDANIGVATGAVSGIVGIDIDVRPGGEASLAKLEAENAPLPPTYAVRTGSGGRHLYFRHPGAPVPNSASQLGRGLDVRGDGGYLIAAGSVHECGGLYEVIDDREPADLPAWLLARIAAPRDEPGATTAPGAAASQERTDFGPEGGTRYGLQALAEEALEVEETPEGERNTALNRSAFRIGRLVAGGELDRRVAGKRLVEAGMTAGLPYDEALRTVKGGLFRGMRRPRSAPPRKRSEKKAKPVPQPRPVENTDLGNARRLAGRFGHELRHCAALGWFTWDGARWRKDETGAAMRLAKATAELIWDEAKTAAKEDQEEKAGWALASQSAPRLEAMLRLAATEERIAVTADTFDRDPWLLNVLNGTIDLRTGTLLPHDPARHMTKMAPVPYDPAATCPRFLRFLGDVFQGNADLIRFVQKALGYALSGDVSFQVLFFLHGEGSNGKSTLITVVLHVMGDYAAPAAPDILLSRHGERHPTEIADLFGRRLVTCVEVGKGRSFNEALVKWLTGGDRIKARHMRMDFFEFEPTHKIFICANNKPRVRETDHAFWRRLQLIPFAVKFVDRPAGATGESGPGEKDPFLVAKLKAEAAGILRWMVEGCLAMQREGLAPPRDVEAATTAYRCGEDVLGLFLDECCLVRPDARVLKGALYDSYVSWARIAGEHVLPMREFRKYLVEKGFTESRVHGGGRAWAGVGLTSSGSAEPPSGDTVTPGDATCPMNDESHTRVRSNRQNASPRVTVSPERTADPETTAQDTAARACVARSAAATAPAVAGIDLALFEEDPDDGDAPDVTECEGACWA